MADKQLARNENVDLNAFSDDDPLSELARIVGYDNRPAVQQLQELERHRQSVRYNPVIDLEDELLRAFDSYDTPAGHTVADVRPVHAPVAAPHVEPVFTAEPEPVVEPEAVVYAEPAYVPAPAIQHEAQPAPVAADDVWFDEGSIDLEQELELSMRQADETPAPSLPAEPVAGEAMFLPMPVQAPGVSAHRAAEAATPAAVNEDPLLATVAHFPMPPVSPVKAPAIQAAAEAGRRNAYPFMPNFSRATPVAPQPGGAHKSFATPLPQVPVIAVAPVAIAALPEIAQQPIVTEAAPVLQAAAEAEPEFDIDSFEIDLSDIELDLDPAEFDSAFDMASDEPADDIAFEPAVFTPEEIAPEPEEAELAFDPTLIAESEESLAVMADLDVPHLHVGDEAEPVVDPGDYDLDIDAEMAQIFSAGQLDAASRGAPGHERVSTRGPVAATVPPRAVHQEFEDFERAMEADFRHTLSQRQEVVTDNDPRAPQAVYANDTYEEERAPSSRRKLFLFASAAVIVLVAGGIGAFTMMGAPGTGLSGGEPQIILADTSPTKMVPVEKGGKSVPNQDKAVYDRVGGAAEEAPQQGTLVSSTEEPIDVVQRTLTPENLPMEGSEDEGMMATPVEEDATERLLPDETVAETEKDVAPAVAPRKVRTMIVKPDGTLVARDEPVDETVASAELPAATVKTAVLKPAELTEQPVPADDTLSALADADVAPVEEAAITQPLPEAKPVQKPVETAAPAEPAVVARKPVDTFASPAAETKPVQTASIAPGSYVVQIASLPSEAEAQRSYQTMSGKFGGVIGGRGVDIKKAEIAGKGTYYRVRIPAGTRDEANSLCAKFKSAGGSCLVTR